MKNHSNINLSNMISQKLKLLWGIIVFLSILGSTNIFSQTACISGSQTICAGSPVDLTVTLTGTANFSFSYSDGTTTYSVTGITGTTYILSLTPSSNTIYNMVSMSDANGPGTVCPLGTPGYEADITVLIIPTATLSSNQTLCQGSTATSLSVNFTSGTSPWKIIYTDGTTPVTVTGITNNPYILGVTPTANSTYTLQTVGDVFQSCFSTGNSITLTLQSLPTAVLSSSQTLCQDASLLNQTANLTVNLTGVSTWSITYNDGINNVPILGINSSPFTFSVSPSQTTTYTIINVTDVFGCSTTTSSSIVVTVNNFPVPSITSASTLVCNSTIGTTFTFNLVGTPNFNLTYTDGTTPVTITGITNSSYVVNISPTSTTSYSVISLTDANNCPTNPNNNVSTIVTVGSTPIVSLSASGSILCQNISGTNTINLSFSISGGTQPWTLSYSQGTTPIVIGGIISSPYIVSVSPTVRTSYHNVLVTDALGCTGSGNTWVIEPQPFPSASFSGNQTICPNSRVQLSINLTGTGPWVINYSDGTTNYTETATTPSPYIVSTTVSGTTTFTILTVSDIYCSNTSNSTATVSLFPAPSGSLSANQTICSGASATLTFSMTGALPWDLVYTIGNTPILVTGITSPTYILQVTPTSTQTYQFAALDDGNGCRVNPGQSAIITVSPVNATISASQSICLGNTAVLTIDLFGFPNWDLTYSDGTNSIIVNGINTNPYLLTLTPSQTTTYTLTNIVDGFGCVQSLSASSTITVNPIPSLIMTSTTPSVCLGQSFNITVSLTGNQPWTFSYSDGTNPTSITGVTTSPYVFSVTPTNTTTFFPVSLIDLNFCSGSVAGNAPIIVHSPPTLSLSSNQPVCVGGTLNISASGVNIGSIYSWSGPSGFTSSATVAQIINVVSANAGVYSLSLNDPNCGIQPTQTINVAIHPTITGATASSNSPVCATQTLNMSSTSFLGATYSWTGPNGFTSSSQNPSIPNVTTSASGQYTVIISSPTCGNAQTITTSVTVTARPTITPGSNSPICQGSNLALTMNTVPNATSYLWTGPIGYSANASPPSNTNRGNAQPTFTGTYTMTVNTSNCGIISDTIYVLVGVSPSSVTLSTNSPFCVGANVNLSAIYSPSPLYGLTINWTGPSGYTHIGTLAPINNIQVSNAGQYTATITSSVAGCNSTTRTINIVVNDPASFTCGSYPNPVCTGSALFLSSQGPAGTTVVWSGPASFNSTLFNPSRSNSQTTFQGIYTVVATIPGCGTTMCTRNVTVNTSTNNNSASSNSPVCAGNTLNLSSNNTQLQGVQFSWVGPNSFASTQQYPTISNAQSINGGIYTVTIWSPGCWTNTRTVTVAVNDPASLTATWTSPVCSGSTLSLQGSGNNATGFSWSGPASFSSTNQNPTRSNMQNSFQGVYTLSATIPGCGILTTTTSSVTITCREGLFSESSKDDSSLVVLESEFHVWPNPANNGLFYFHLPQEVKSFKAFLVNSLGQKIEVSHPYILSTGKSEWEVQIPAYIVSGKYLLLIQSEHFTLRKSLWISKE